MKFVSDFKKYRKNHVLCTSHSSGCDVGWYYYEIIKILKHYFMLKLVYRRALFWTIMLQYIKDILCCIVPTAQMSF